MPTKALRRFPKKKLMKAIEGSGGVVSMVAKRLGCAWSTAEKYIHNWEDTAEAFRDECEQILDMAESQVYKSIQEGNSTDAKWLLATKGKGRGYSERTELTGPEGRDMKIIYEIVRPDQNLIEGNTDASVE